MRFDYAVPGRGVTAVTVDLEGMAPGDHLAREIARAGSFYELDLLEHLAEHGPRGGVSVDVGAEIGNHSVDVGRALTDRLDDVLATVLRERRPDLVVELEDDRVHDEVRRFLEPQGYRQGGRSCWTPTWVFRWAGEPRP